MMEFLKFIQSINMVDYAIVLFLIFGLLIGYSQGIVKKAASSLGMLASVLLAYLFRKPIGYILYSIFPFFKFSGRLEGLSALNIIIYELIAFLLIFTILMLVYRLVLKLANVTEKIVEATIVLNIPAKILGALFGLVEAYLISFVVVLIISIPIFNVSAVKNSKIANVMLEKTPVVSAIAKKAVVSINEINDEINNSKNTKKLNDKIIKILIDNKVISVKTANKLIKNKKLGK